MRTVPRWDLHIWRGADFSEKMTLLQYKDGPAMSFTGLTLLSQIREHPDFSSTLIATFTISEPTAGGVIYLTLTKATTSAITYSGGYYDLSITTTATGVSMPYIYGDVIFEDAKTYAE